MSTTLTKPAASRHDRAVRQPASALKTTVSVLGVIVAAAGAEHGVGEILQGPGRPAGVMIESWPDTRAFEALAGEPAMTIMPNLLVAGLTTLVLAAALAAWSIWFIDRRHGAVGLLVLSAALLLAGGGLSPPVLGAILAIAAARLGAPVRREPGIVSRRLASVWAWLLGAAVLGYLGLVPGMVIFVDFAEGNPGFVYGLTAFAVSALVAALVAARAHDRIAAHVNARTEGPNA
jgi:hypothetical protein